MTWKIGKRVARDDSWPDDTRRLTATFPYNYRRLFPHGPQTTIGTEEGAGEYDSDSENPSPTTTLGYTVDELVQPVLPKSPHGPAHSELRTP